ncbi:GyrI-like domain-containing protein [Micromonospora sp. ZYX-F-536]|uniref:GyrI-like domain-containing protein n=1 Tax=Micromonospora sp. ZYX-F-536 TaxID=3457629 RepID=UPI004040937C
MTNKTEAKIDFKKTLDAYQAQPGRFRTVDVPDMQYLMIDGHGDPNTSPAFTAAIEALYPTAYKLKFASKRGLGRDYVVPPLEGLWWAEDMASFTTARHKSRWHWTLMLMVPDWIDQSMFTTAVGQVGAKHPPTRLDDVRLRTLSEGRCVQTLHVGSFDDESDVLAQLHHQYIPANRLRMAGTHHEIYLSDFRRVAPGKQRTILRQPVTIDPGSVDPGPVS